MANCIRLALTLIFVLGPFGCSNEEDDDVAADDDDDALDDDSVDDDASDSCFCILKPLTPRHQVA